MFNYKDNKIKCLFVSLIVFSIFSYLTFTLFLNYKINTSINNSDKIVIHVLNMYFDDNGAQIDTTKIDLTDKNQEIKLLKQCLKNNIYTYDFFPKTWFRYDKNPNLIEYKIMIGNDNPDHVNFTISIFNQHNISVNNIGLGIQYTHINELGFSNDLFNEVTKIIY